MYEEDVATMNGYTEHPVLAPAERSGDPEVWAVHEDVWAGEETSEDLLTELQEQPYEVGAQEESGFETPVQEDTFESGSFESGSFESPPSWESALEDTAWEEDSALESVHASGESAYEDTAPAEADEDTGYEQTGDEQTGFEQTGYEQTGYEQTGHEQTGYEDLGLEGGASEEDVLEAWESFFEQPAGPGGSNPELLEWPGEISSEDWAASGGSAEHLQEERPGARVPAGERTVADHPLLRSHRGTQPDLVVRWNAMPRSTTTVDVVVHLHGYSASGARMRIQDKAAASGVDLGSPGPGGTARPMLGLIPRGNFFGGQSGTGYNFPQLVQPGAVGRLVASGLELLRAQTGVRATMGRLVLTGHSGGGAPLDAILRHTDADEVLVFDGTYGDMGHLISWARRRIAQGSPSSALRVLYRPGTGTAKHALAVAAAICPAITAAPGAVALHRRFRVEATTVEHNLIPRTFGGRLLADPGADLPGAVRRGCAHDGGTPSTPAAPPTPGSVPSVTTRTPDRAAGVVRVTPYAKDGTQALPGAKALAAQWRRLTGRTAGTFNPRNTAFGTRSLHSEGRAIDCHGHVGKPAEAAQAEAYIRWLVANAVELQVATIIWNRRIWSWHRRAQGWRSYMTKPNHNPHTDHFHVDLSWEGALHPSPLFAGGVPGLAGGAAPSPSGSTPPAPAGPAGPPASAPSSGPAPQPGSKRSPADFVRAFGPFAKASEARTGVPGLVTLAQAAVESGWGARAAGHNFFGIKARAADAPGTRQLWRTREVLNRPDVRSFPEVISVTRRPDGRYDYVVRDWFRVFPSPELAFVGHGEFLRRNKRYAPAFGFVRDPYRFATEVARAGYATDPRYAEVVHSVMRLLERSGWR